MANPRNAKTDLPKLAAAEDEGEREATATETLTRASPISSRSSERARFTAMTGASAGMVIALDRDVTIIGRAADAEIRLDETGVSRNHARVTRTHRGSHLLEDLGSKNGTLLNGSRVSARHEILEVGDRVQIGPVVLQFGLLDDAEDKLARRLYESSTRDSLTKSYNRRFLMERFEAELSFAKRHSSMLGVIMFDIDYFKKVNDAHGHDVGDKVLSAVAARVLKLIRKEDTFARYGGEEFAILVRDLTHENAMRFAERVRKAVEGERVPVKEGVVGVTISLGVAALVDCKESPTPTRLLTVADKRLYRAKELGRNRVCGD